METSSLIQILKAPEKRKGWGAFGAGGDGGFSDEAKELIDPIFSFHYMGAGQFEWGAVPEALLKIGNFYVAKRQVIGEIDLDGPVYYLCLDQHEKEVVRRITKLGNKGDYNGEWSLKAPSSFKAALLARSPSIDSKWAEVYKGWLELNNGYMFFLDKEMFEKTDAMFKTFDE